MSKSFWPRVDKLSVTLLALLLASCNGAQQNGSGPVIPQQVPRTSPAPKFAHVIVMIQENRSFDNFFATYPGADGTTTGQMIDPSTGKVETVPLTMHSILGRDIGHTWQKFVQSYDGGKMDGFSLNGWGGWGGGPPIGAYPYQYVDPAQIAPYWTMANQYVLADHFFETQSSGSFIAHQDLIAAGTPLSPYESLTNYPTNVPWGCDAPAGTKTSILNNKGALLAGKGPFPCMSYTTLANLLDAKGVSWKYYAPPLDSHAGYLWSAFDAIDAVRHGSQWNTNVVHPNTAIFDDIRNGALPQFAWLLPDHLDSDHPGARKDTGPSWVASVVNAVGKSKYWNSTVILVTWDDWGGFYDHVKPPHLDYQGLGFRVPLLAISAYAKKGHVSHNQYEFGSILKFAEDNWQLGTLNHTDARAADFVNDFFSFSQPPRKFVPISAKYTQNYFERRPPSYQPVDDQ
jgi:phospholipase C